MIKYCDLKRSQIIFANVKRIQPVSRGHESKRFNLHCLKGTRREVIHAIAAVTLRKQCKSKRALLTRVYVKKLALYV